jgi:hypothetical protein
MPYHSPADGLPEPVAPPTVLSFEDVNVTGAEDVPDAFKLPSTPIDTDGAAFTTAPGATVSVAPAGTSTEHVRTWTLDGSQVSFDTSLPQWSRTAGGDA